MQIKRFEAFEMSEALRVVREELGPEAVILSTREIRKEEFGLLSRPVIEITAAIDPPPSSRPSQAAAVPKFQKLLEEVNGAGELPATELSAVREELQALREAVESLRSGSGAGKASSFSGLHSTWLEMKGALRTLIEQQFRGELAQTHENLIALFNRLAVNGVDPQRAMGLIRTLREKLTPEELWKEDFVQYYLREMIQGMIQVSGPLQGASEEARAVALVGPTGVGKTTTVLKLAAERALQKQEPVTLASLDTYRVGATEQLKSYARMIGVPVLLAASGAELRQMIARRKPKGLVLIDTPGRSHLNSRQVAELKDLEKVGTPVETHLVLSSNVKEADLNEAIDRFSVLPINRLLFTKVDETRTFGGLLSAVCGKEKPISYFATGQRVPDDLEVATPKRVAELILD